MSTELCLSYTSQSVSAGYIFQMNFVDAQTDLSQLGAYVIKFTKMPHQS